MDRGKGGILVPMAAVIAIVNRRVDKRCYVVKANYLIKQVDRSRRQEWAKFGPAVS